MKTKTAVITAAAVALLAGSSWAVTIDGNFDDWSAVPVACTDPVNSPLVDSTNDFEYRGLGSLDFGALSGTPLLPLMDIPPLPDGPYAEVGPAPENELDVEFVQHALEGGTLYIRAKMAPGVSFDVADTGPTPPSAISANWLLPPGTPVFEQSIYDILIDVDPGTGTGFQNDFTYAGNGPKHFSALDGADYLVEITEPLWETGSIYHLYRYTGDGSSFDWEWVAEIQGGMDSNSLEIAVPLAQLNLAPVCGRAIGYAMATSDSEDWWGDDIVPGYLGEIGKGYWYAYPPVDWWVAGLPPGLTPESVIEPKRYIPIAFDGPEFCPPDLTACPRTQGYWWRQATSLSLITGYRGREKRVHPDWTRAQLQALFAAVDPLLAFSGQTTAQALWANPALSMREKSLKQFAALLLNVESGFLSPAVPVDLGAWGLGEKTVGEVLSLLQTRWLAGEYTFVNAVADSINTGKTIDLSAGCSE